MTTQIEPVVQPEISDLPETKETEVKTVVDTMPDDFKKDFFKHKQAMKEAQEQRDELAAKLEMIEQEENVRKGNYQTVIDTLKEENKTLKGSIEDSLKQRRIDKLDRALIQKATELGFKKPKEIKRFLDSNERKLLSIDSDFNVDEYGLEKAMESVKKNWEDLFQAKKIVIADGNPITNLNKTQPKSVNKMTTDERMKLILEKTKK